MVKMLVTWIIVIAIIVDFVAFFGAGIGLGVLAQTGVPTSFEPTWNNGSSGPGGALTFGIWNTVGDDNVPFVSSLIAGGQSTTIDFGIIVTSNGNCGGSGDPVAAIGGTDPSYFTIDFTGESGLQAADWVINGQQDNAVVAVLSLNNTNNGGSNNPNLVGCTQTFNAFGQGQGNVYTTNIYAGGPVSDYEMLKQSLAIDGLVGTGTISIVYHQTGAFCDGAGAGGVTAASGSCASFCQAVSGSVTFAGLAATAPCSGNGPWSTTSSVSIPVISGSGSVVVNGGGPWYNGGTIGLTINTGYGGPSGYEMTMHEPGARGATLGSGNVATDFNPNPVVLGNNLVDDQFTWSIPNDASQQCTAAGCNEFVIVLTSSLYINEQLNIPIDISPAYAPQNISVTVSDVTSGAAYPSQGDTEQVSMSATSSVSNNSVTSFLLFVYHLLPGQDVHTPPGLRIPVRDAVQWDVDHGDHDTGQLVHRVVFVHREHPEQHGGVRLPSPGGDSFPAVVECGLEVSCSEPGRLQDRHALQSPRRECAALDQLGLGAPADRDRAHLHADHALRADQPAAPVRADRWRGGAVRRAVRLRRDGSALRTGRSLRRSIHRSRLRWPTRSTGSSDSSGSSGWS